MQPHYALILALATYALVRFYVLPVASALWNQGNLERKLTKAPSVAALEKLAEVALMAALLLAAVCIMIVALGVIGGSNLDTVNGALKVMPRIVAVLKSISKWWGGTFFAFAFLVMGYFWYRSMSRAILKEITSAIQQQAEKRKSDGTWQEMELTPEMSALLRQIQQAFYDLESATDADIAERSRQTKILEDLKMRYAALELERRIQLAWTQDPPLHTGLARRVFGTMTSKSAFSRGKAATRWLSRATTLTVFASLIGYQLGNIQDTAIKRQVELEDLQINLSASQAERELKQALTTTREEVSEDTNDGSTALRQLARSFATTFARTWRTAEAHNATEARAERARQIVELRNDIHAEREAGSTKFWSADEVASAWPGEIRAAVSDFAKDTLGQEFSTPLQERFIRDAAKENLHRDSRVKGFWARMAKEGPGREPIPIRDLIDYQIEETVGALVDGILGETISCEMCKSALKSLSTYAKERIKRTYRIAWAKYVASFLRTGDLGVAEAAVRTSCSDLPMDELRATISSITRSPTKTIASIRAAKAKARARGAETQLYRPALFFGICPEMVKRF